MTTSSPQPPVPTSLDAWLGKTETLGDDITAFPLNALAATLDRPSPGDFVPPMWHWLYFLPVARASHTGDATS